MSLILFIANISYGQNPELSWTKYTIADGLPSNEVHHTAETPDGYIWFATDHGLSRYDGYEFKNYGIEEGLDDLVVFYLQVDSKGTLWALSMSNNLYYISDDKVIPYKNNHLINEIIKQFESSSIPANFIITKNDELYINIQGAGIIIINNNRVELFKFQPGDFNKYSIDLGDNYISNDNRHSPIILKNQLSSSIKYKWKIFKQKRNIELNHKRSLTSTGYRHMYKYANNTDIYFDYISVSIGNQTEITNIIPLPSYCNYKAKICRPDYPIHLGYSLGEGLRVYEDLDALVENNYKQYLKGKSISSLYIDNNKTLWATTTEHGIFKCINSDLQLYNSTNVLLDNNVTSMDTKNKHELILGFPNGKTATLNTQSSILKHLPPLKRSTNVYDILHDPINDEIWVANGRLSSLRNGKWVDYFGQDERSHTARVINDNIYLDTNSRHIWGSGKNHFGSFDMDRSVFDYVSPRKHLGLRTRSIFVNKQKNKWIGTDHGLFLLENSNLTPDSIINFRVNDIKGLSDSTLVLATNGHGIVLKKADRYQFITNNSLSSNVIKNIYVDNVGQIWAGTLNGLNKVVGFSWSDTSSVYEITTYNTTKGLPSNQINEVRVIEDNVWVATTKGLVSFPNNENIDSISRVPIFTKIDVNNNAISADSVMTFSNNENNISIHYVCIDHHQNGNINYRYRLNDAPWTNTRQRSINYASLNDDEYKFEVQSQNRDGYWSKSSVYHFTINPPFWKTWWFTFIAILAIYSAIFMYFKLRLNRLKKTADIELEITTLERKALSAQMNPHFTFNCLNSISTLISRGDKETANHYLTTFAHLLRGVLNHSRQNTITLEDEIELLNNYLKMEQLRFPKMFKYTFKVDENLDLFTIDIPPMLIQPFLENSIIHGIQNKSETGKIDIEITKPEGSLIVSIRDNGIGIEHSKQSKRTKQHQSESSGMHITGRRLELLKLNKQKGHYESIELRNKSGQVTGTMVTISIPLLQEQLSLA